MKEKRILDYQIKVCKRELLRAQTVLKRAKEGNMSNVGIIYLKAHVVILKRALKLLIDEVTNLNK